VFCIPVSLVVCFADWLAPKGCQPGSSASQTRLPCRLLRRLRTPSGAPPVHTREGPVGGRTRALRVRTNVRTVRTRGLLAPLGCQALPSLLVCEADEGEATLLRREPPKEERSLPYPYGGREGERGRGKRRCSLRRGAPYGVRTLGWEGVVGTHTPSRFRSWLTRGRSTRILAYNRQLTLLLIAHQ
jgi:hypothetical protein